MTTARERYEDVYRRCLNVVAPRENAAMRAVGAGKSGKPQSQISATTQARRAQVRAYLANHPRSETNAIAEACGLEYDAVNQDCRRMSERGELRKDVLDEKGKRRRVWYSLPDKERGKTK